jgi:aldehyde:ferredoxin oxidoreductase
VEAGDTGPLTNALIFTEADEGSSILKRWGRSDPSKWKRNVHSECQPYSSKNLQPAKATKNADCSPCKFRCQQHFERKTDATSAKLTES